MPSWKIAAVQMDVAFADKAKNLETIRARLREAADNGAQLVIFPECALPGYCFESKDEALPHTEPIPGPSTRRWPRIARSATFSPSSVCWKQRATSFTTPAR